MGTQRPSAGFHILFEDRGREVRRDPAREGEFPWCCVIYALFVTCFTKGRRRRDNIFNIPQGEQGPSAAEVRHLGNNKSDNGDMQGLFTIT